MKTSELREYAPTPITREDRLLPPAKHMDPTKTKYLGLYSIDPQGVVRTVFPRRPDAHLGGVEL